MKLNLINNLIAVGSGKKEKKDFLSMPTDENSTGIIKYIGEDYEGPLQVGMLVCYGDNRTKVKIPGEELEIMESSNIFGILSDEEQKSEEAESKAE